MDNKHRELFVVKQSKGCQVYAENAAKCAWRPGSAQTRWGSLCAPSPSSCNGVNTEVLQTQGIIACYMEKHYLDISTLFQEADDALFSTTLSNRSHVLYTYLSERPEKRIKTR